MKCVRICLLIRLFQLHLCLVCPDWFPSYVSPVSNCLQVYLNLRLHHSCARLSLLRCLAYCSCLLCWLKTFLFVCFFPLSQSALLDVSACLVQLLQINFWAFWTDHSTSGSCLLMQTLQICTQQLQIYVKNNLSANLQEKEEKKFAPLQISTAETRSPSHYSSSCVLSAPWETHGCLVYWKEFYFYALPCDCCTEMLA